MDRIVAWLNTDSISRWVVDKLDAFDRWRNRQ